MQFFVRLCCCPHLYRAANAVRSIHFFPYILVDSSVNSMLRLLFCNIVTISLEAQLECCKVVPSLIGIDPHLSSNRPILYFSNHYFLFLLAAMLGRGASANPSRFLSDTRLAILMCPLRYLVLSIRTKNNDTIVAT